MVDFDISQIKTFSAICDGANVATGGAAGYLIAAAVGFTFFFKSLRYGVKRATLTGGFWAMITSLFFVLFGCANIASVFLFTLVMILGWIFL